ncbi:MAG: response regulator [Pseudomonadota bacterium]
MLNGLAILLAEDNPTNQIVAAEMLANLGAEVVVAEDGLAALDRLAERRFDLLMVDMEMPRLSGAQLIERLRAAGGVHAEAPIIVLTAYLTRADIERAERAGADGFIAKPLVSIERFGAEIVDILGRDWRQCGVVADDTSPTPSAQPASNSTSAAAAEPVYDTAPIDSLLRIADRVSAQALIDRALADLGAEVATLVAHLTAGRREDAAASAHRLAGMAGAVGGMRLGAVARWAQEAPHTVDAQTVAALWDQTRTALENAKADLN